MKKRIYTVFAISVLIGSAAGLFLVMTALFNIVGEDMTLKSESDMATTVAYQH